MNNLRTYGSAPYTVAVVHGGPGAPGQMAPVARELASTRGVLEPLQTADSIDGQVDELRDVLTEYADCPVTLIGSSWGAMLGFIFAARYPALLGKLILVGSGSFEARYATDIQKTRLGRLTEDERRESADLTAALDNPVSPGKDVLLARLGRLFTKSDAFDPLTLDTENLEVRYDIHVRVWSEAAELRRSGKLLALGKSIQCPVTAIHGDYDPHPADGVREPLASVLKDFRFIPLERCGHLPWIERQAWEEFFRILRDELETI